MVAPVPVPIVPNVAPLIISGGAASNIPEWLYLLIIIFLIGCYPALGAILFECRDYEDFYKFSRYKRIIIKLSYVFLWPLKLIQLLILFIIK